MVDLKVEIFSTVVLILAILLLISITNRAIKRFGRPVSIDVNKRKIIFYISHLVLYFIGFTILSNLTAGVILFFSHP